MMLLLSKSGMNAKQLPLLLFLLSPSSFLLRHVSGFTPTLSSSSTIHNTSTTTKSCVPNTNTILQMTSPSSSSSSSSTSPPPNNGNEIKIIDSHLHIWATESESQTTYPYASSNQTPPPSLIDSASPTALLAQMSSQNLQQPVAGALIVQPINHLYNHDYVLHAIQKHPNYFKGMLLHDPTTTTTASSGGVDTEEETYVYVLERLEELVLQGFVGVRFNPYLWPQNNDKNNDKNIYMSKGSGLQVYKRCGELGIPVGIMCFKGLDLHYDDIIQLLEKSPETTMILDHFGFTFLNENEQEATTTAVTTQMKQLLSLAKYENVVIKISALFRIANNVDTYPYHRVKKERFDLLIEAFGKDRLMFGSDFPFVLNEEGSYNGTVDLVMEWTKDDVDVQAAIMGGTAERLFGVWGGGDQ